MSNYSRWKDTVEKYDREDGICPLLDDVFEQGKEEAVEEAIELINDIDYAELSKDEFFYKVCDVLAKLGEHKSLKEILEDIEKYSKEQKE